MNLQTMTLKILSLLPPKVARSLLDRANIMPDDSTAKPEFELMRSLLTEVLREKIPTAMRM